jgi:hypothetical protein
VMVVLWQGTSRAKIGMYAGNEKNGVRARYRDHVSVLDMRWLMSECVVFFSSSTRPMTTL